jgi:putative SOS response-associated peptidase YedK
MCGRYVLADLIRLAQKYSVDLGPFELKPRYNVSPGSAMPVIRRQTRNEVEIMRWGLIPSWAPESKIGYTMINARADTILEKRSYSKPFKSQRCIVPSSGFYEWKKDGKNKTPYFIRVKDEPVVGFAGIYDLWKAPNLQDVLSFSIITTDANEAIRHIHDRMPVILTPEAELAWLETQYEAKDLIGLLKPYPAEKMEAYTVSTKVNSARNESPDLIDRFEEHSSSLLL